MALLEKRKTEGLLPSLRSNFDELFDFERFFDEPGLRLPWNNGRLNKVPATNIREMDKEFVVELAAPGLTKKDFHVDVDDNILEIKVEKEEERKEEREKYTRKEYDYRAFYRSFTLPENVQGDKIKAEYKDGLLKVHLPKSPEAKKKPSKEISVD